MKYVAIGVVAAVPFALPSQSLVTIAMLTVFSAFLGQCWNISGGFGGLTSFGHAVFFGTGAYVAAIVQTRFGLNPWLGLPAAAVAGAVVGGVIGAASFRAGLRGSYFALVTLAEMVLLPAAAILPMRFQASRPVALNGPAASAAFTPAMSFAF